MSLRLQLYRSAQRSRRCRLLSGVDNAQSAIEVDGLFVHRGGRLVLDSIGFSVPQGGVTGLLGPSGSGKTTLMRSIVGVQRVTAGRVTVLGQPAGSAALRHTVGYMTQAPSIYADLTVRENARYFGSLYGVTHGEAEQAVDDVGLGRLRGRVVSTLSGGERARISLACALLSNPKLLVLDEPTVGQDPVLRAELWQRFHDLAGRGVTLLVSSHVMDEAARCDRLLLIRNGKLIADDTPDGVRDSTGTRDLDEAFLRMVLSERGQKES